MNLINRARAALALAIAPDFTRTNKSSLVGSLLRMLNIGNAVWTPRQYDKLAEVAYQFNVIGYRATSLVSRSFAGIPIGLYEPDGDEVEEHPVLDLLKKPNPWQSGRRFRENLCGYFCLSGNAYIEGVDANLDNGDKLEAGPNMGIPLELYTHRPDRINIVMSKVGSPLQFIYKAQGSERVWNVDPFTGSGPLLHVKTFHPLNDYYGMSPIEAAGWSIDQHNESSAWNKSLLQNGARPSGAMVYKPSGVIGATLTDEQFRALRDQIDERISGPNNAAKPLILDGGMEWQETGMSPRDMDWLKGRDNAAREIAMAFGVPAQMLGIPGDNTYNNMAEAKASFYEETVIPLGESLLEALSNWLLPCYGLEGYCLKMELDDVSALFPRRKEKWDMIATADFLTINEKRRQLDYDDLDSPLADELLIKTGLTPIDDLGATDESVDPITGETIPAATSFSQDRGGKPKPGDKKKDPGQAEGDPEDNSGEEIKGHLDNVIKRLSNGYAIKRRK